MAMTSRKSLILIVIVLLQACLLNARQLRVAVIPAIASQLQSNDPFASQLYTSPTTPTNGHPGNTIPPSNAPPTCAPHKNQLKYYNGLYSTNSPNTFNGNILFYALKAVETHKNRSVSVVTAEENKTIANITDVSRFVPAGMDLVNKVVCAKILQEMDAEASLFSNTALCPWDYVCDYDASRYPHYLFKARCKTPKCNVTCSRETNQNHRLCQSHGIHVTILEKSKCNVWVWGQELLPLACTCTSTEIMTAENRMQG